MKDFVIVYIIWAFIGLVFVFTALLVTVERSNYVARMATDQADFDYYIFIEPDGQKFIPAENIDLRFI